MPAIRDAVAMFAAAVLGTAYAAVLLAAGDVRPTDLATAETPQE